MHFLSNLSHHRRGTRLLFLKYETIGIVCEICFTECFSSTWWIYANNRYIVRVHLQVNCREMGRHWFLYWFVYPMSTWDKAVIHNGSLLHLNNKGNDIRWHKGRHVDMRMFIKLKSFKIEIAISLPSCSCKRLISSSTAYLDIIT